LPPHLQQAPSRDKGDKFASVDIHEQPRTPNISTTLTEREARHHQENKRGDLTGRREAGGEIMTSSQQTNANALMNETSRKRILPPCLQKAPSRNERDNFVSLDIHECPRTPKVSTRPTEQKEGPHMQERGRRKE
jgi:hypothetical protein